MSFLFKAKLLLIVLIMGPVLATDLEGSGIRELSYIRIVAREVLITSQYGKMSQKKIQTQICSLHAQFNVTPYEIYQFGLPYKKSPAIARILDRKIRKEIQFLNRTKWLEMQ